MTYNKRLSLLLVALLATSTTLILAHEINDNIWECQHDNQDHAVPDVIEVEEEGYNPEGNDLSGRTLASYNNMRTYGYYGALGSSSFASYIRNELIPPILDYYGAALKIKYPVVGDLKVATSTVCGIATPSVLRTGVAADYAYLVTIDSSSSYVASSSACSMASGTNRPLVGHTVISSYYMQATSDPLLHERNMVCIMHEVVHTLGWTNGMYTSWLDYQTGKRISSPTVNVGLDGGTSMVVQAEPIRTMVRDHFGCASIAGAYLENSGGSGTANTHFERRQFVYEAMTSGLIYQMQFSKFTLGMLESMGWYAPDYTYADAFFFGQGQGCNFLTETCTSANRQFADLCDSSARGCTTPGRGGANCQSDPRTDGCEYWFPQISYDCENPESSSYARLASLQTFGRGLNSKCFTGSLSSGSAGASTSFCFKYTCNGAGSSTTLTLDVGTKQVTCAREGAVSVSGYAGSINCPDPLTFCSTVGQKICPRNCMGRGTCNNGVCACKAGYKGSDCALSA